MKKIEPILKSVLLSAIWIYRTLISPWTGHECRFLPTCSEYGREAIQTHGAWQGLILTVKRIGKCHPWGEHGLDFVPKKQHRVKR